MERHTTLTYKHPESDKECLDWTKTDSVHKDIQRCTKSSSTENWISDCSHSCESRTVSRYSQSQHYKRSSYTKQVILVTCPQSSWSNSVLSYGRETQRTLLTIHCNTFPGETMYLFIKSTYSPIRVV